MDKPIEVQGNLSYQNLYKIDIHLGDRIRDFSLYFPKIESCTKWKRALSKASGDYRLSDYYSLPNENTEVIIGASGRTEVKKGIHTDSKYPIAIKTISLRDKDFSEADVIENEIYLMRMGIHQNVVRLLDSFRTATEFNLVLEWERGGTLQNYLVERNNLLKEVRAKDIAQKLALGIEYLHEQGIMIDNINLRTILMNDQTNDSVPRISNFSRARTLDPNQQIHERSANQTLFLAPEICENKPYDLKADCWAFGVVLYFMLASQFHITDETEDADPAFETAMSPRNLLDRTKIESKQQYLDDKEIRKGIVNYVFNETPLSKRQKTTSSIDLVQRLLAKDPAKRLTMH